MNKYGVVVLDVPGKGPRALTPGRVYVNKHGVRVLDIPGEGPRALTPEPPRSSQGDSPPVSNVSSPRSPVSSPSSSVSPGSISPVDPETSVYDATVPEITFEDILKLVRKDHSEMSEEDILQTTFNIFISLTQPETYGEETVVPGIPVDAPGIAVEPEPEPDSGTLVGGKRNKPTKRRKKYTKRIRKRKKTNKRSRKKQKK